MPVKTGGFLLEAARRSCGIILKESRREGQAKLLVSAHQVKGNGGFPAD